MTGDIWGVMLRQALAMGIVPEAFWRLSLREWRMLTESAGGAVSLPRGVLDEMMERWPDGGRV
ncbi:phage tail assembly chaperone [Brevundimonas sp.]|uniref:phage tail assembly chaperone n=1 Tax=Brevundimonas sp. TaxID=1871086 RepID=UPI00289CFA8A|nr:phage tail assembly chaperone [Brevundimonas sp.]